VRSYRAGIRSDIFVYYKWMTSARGSWIHEQTRYRCRIL